MTALPAAAEPSGWRAPQPAAGALLDAARARERTAAIPEAVAAYEVAIAAAERAGEQAVLAEALRRLAVVRHRGGDSSEARALCRRSHATACAAGDGVRAAEALNALGGIDLETAAMAEARDNFLRALALGGQDRALRARVEQNLGILANIQGEFSEALACYGRSLEACRAAADEPGCAIAYHNLAMASADCARWDAAEGYFRQSLEIARRTRDSYLVGLCLANHAKVHHARARYEDARCTAAAALATFDQLGVASAKADAYRVLGMVYRDTGRPALAEARLRAAIELAGHAGAALNEAEASRELAVLYQGMGRNLEALTLLNAAHRLFRRLDARVALVHIAGKVADLEAAYLAVVREWGQSIESADTYTFGHCERVARRGVAVAQALGFDEQAATTVRLGAYLHDLGKLRVPPELLAKPGPLTRAEFAVVQRHTIWGIELLAAVEFPWDLKPVIRSHHERYDGTGYPDRLRGEEIPLAAQIVALVDVYDALTTARPYRLAFSPAAALAKLEDDRRLWSPRVYAAFLQALTEAPDWPALGGVGSSLSVEGVARGRAAPHLGS